MLPYWAEAAAFARAHGVRVAIEPHPGLRRLQHRLDAAPARARGRRASASTSTRRTSSGRGWTRSPACRALAGAIFHVHAKDTALRRAEPRAQRRPRAAPERPPGGAELDLPLGRRGPPGPVLARPRASPCRTPATTARSRSSTRTRCSPARTVSRVAVATLARGRSVPELVRRARRRHDRRQGRRGRARRRRRRGRGAGLPALDSPRGLVGAGSRGLVAREPRRARAPRGRSSAPARRSPASASPARCTASSPSTPSDRVDPPGDPLERPAHRGGVRRDRGADRPRAPDRA